MLIGVPKEIKKHEYRVGLTPESVSALVRNDHDVIIETNAGKGIGYADTDYQQVGASIVDSAADIYSRSDMVIKVKEPQPGECKLLRKGQILFAYLHLAPDLEQTKLLQASGCIAIAYETVTDAAGSLPLLQPMSEVAGRLSIQAGAYCLEKQHGGRGVLLGGVPGVSAANVLVLGGGVVGTNAIRMAVGMEARVTVFDKSLSRLRALDDQFGSRLNTIYSTDEAIEKYLKYADLVVGAVLVPGGASPKLIRKSHLKLMKAGSVIVDVAIDQGGCCETSHATTYDTPTFIVDDVVHYCVANMPGGVPRTSTLALNNATLPYALELANKGYREALLADPGLLAGLNVYEGKLTYQAVANALGLNYIDAQQALTQH